MVSSKIVERGTRQPAAAASRSSWKKFSNFFVSRQNFPVSLQIFSSSLQICFASLKKVLPLSKMFFCLSQKCHFLGSPGTVTSGRWIPCLPLRWCAQLGPGRPQRSGLLCLMPGFFTCKRFSKTEAHMHSHLRDSRLGDPLGVHRHHDEGLVLVGLSIACVCQEASPVRLGG